MSIKKIKDFEKDALIDKFVCLDSMLTYMEVGRPVRVTKVSGSRLYYAELPSYWDKDKQAHVFFDPTTVGGEYGRESYCQIKPDLYACDTFEEASGLYNKAKATMDAIDAFIKAQRKAFHDDIAASQAKNQKPKFS